MRLRCLRAKRRKQAATAPQAAAAAPREPNGPAVTIESVFEDPAEGEAAPPAWTLQSEPILRAWPEGYLGFRLDGDDIVLFAEGKLELRLSGGRP